MKKEKVNLCIQKKKKRQVSIIFFEPRILLVNGSLEIYTGLIYIFNKPVFILHTFIFNFNEKLSVHNAVVLVDFAVTSKKRSRLIFLLRLISFNCKILNRSCQSNSIIHIRTSSEVFPSFILIRRLFIMFIPINLNT